MADMRIQYSECLVGANMPGKQDVLNRLPLVSLRQDGSLRDTNLRGTTNVFIGFMAGTSTTTGIYNTFIGKDAGLLNTTGKFNTFVG